jgi:hypothetical protein
LSGHVRKPESNLINFARLCKSAAQALAAFVKNIDNLVAAQSIMIEIDVDVEFRKFP